MKHVHSFCEKEGIKYSLGYGSLIGAIRHKGFIPWDDDMDIVMMRDDFERFCQLYTDSPDYKLFSFYRSNMYATCARVCDMKRTFVRTGSPLFTEPTGLWIDIFPLDSVDDDRTVFDKKKTSVIEIQNEIFKCRMLSRRIGLRDIYHNRSIRALYSRVLNTRRARQSLWSLVQKQNDICCSFASSDSKMMSMLVFPAYIDKDYSPKWVFDEVEDAPFENASFKIMKGYDRWLSIIYGDYMTPPSDDKSKRGHTVHKYFWR